MGFRVEGLEFTPQKATLLRSYMGNLAGNPEKEGFAGPRSGRIRGLGGFSLVVLGFGSVDKASGS